MVELDELKEIFKEAEIANAQNMTLETKIFYDLNVDSISIMEAICQIEEKYNAVFDENQLEFVEDMSAEEFLELINQVIH